jgi:hypothetical protein
LTALPALPQLREEGIYALKIAADVLAVAAQYAPSIRRIV